MELVPAEQIALWFHYEEIAMHFNQLLIQYRLQLMGGIGAIGAVGSYLVAFKTEDANRAGVRLIVSSTLLLLVFAAAILDLCYYYKLLEGAVSALLELEEKNPTINMSTHIHRAVGGQAMPVIIFWYSSIIVPLLIFVGWSAWVWWNPKK